MKFPRTDLAAEAFDGVGGDSIPGVSVHHWDASDIRMTEVIISDPDGAELLGKPYALRAPIVHGKGLGHKIGIPTINQFFPDGILPPKAGVYITDCTVDGRTYRGVSNVGVHPTVDHAAALNCETHLLDCNEDLYDKIATVQFLERLRGEEKFDSIDALTRQIAFDAQVAKAYNKKK